MAMATASPSRPSSGATRPRTARYASAPIRYDQPMMPRIPHHDGTSQADPPSSRLPRYSNSTTTSRAAAPSFTPRTRRRRRASADSGWGLHSNVVAAATATVNHSSLPNPMAALSSRPAFTKITPSSSNPAARGSTRPSARSRSPSTNRPSDSGSDTPARNRNQGNTMSGSE